MSDAGTAQVLSDRIPEREQEEESDDLINFWWALIESQNSEGSRRMTMGDRYVTGAKKHKDVFGSKTPEQIL